MVLSDVNGNGKKSAAERWLRQRNGQRASAARCIFGPPEKRAQLMVLMRNEAEMDRKRAEFAARYELVGLSANERRNFYDGLVKTSSSSPPISHNNRQQQHYCGGHPQNNNDHARNTKSASDHHHYHHNQQQQQHHNSYYHHQQQKNNSFNQPDDERN